MKKTLKRLFTLAFCATIMASMSLSASAATCSVYQASSTSQPETLNVLAYSSSGISNGTDVTTWSGAAFDDINTLPDTQTFVLNASSFSSGRSYVLTAKGNPTYVVSYNRVSKIPEMWAISSDNPEEEHTIFYSYDSYGSAYLYFDKVVNDPCLKLTSSLLYENGVAKGHRLTTVNLSTATGELWNESMYYF